MSGAADSEGTYVYAISCRRLGLLKLGVADQPRKRLRELQVGSPLELTLAHTHRYGERADAVAVCEELYRCFAERRDRGRWYRLTVEQLRYGLSRPATVEAPQRARAAEAARESQLTDRRKRSGRRTEKQLAYERRRRQQRRRMQRRAARLLSWMTQEQAAAVLGVSSRTLRNWKSAPAFRRELERARQPRLHQPASERSRRATSPARRQPDDRRRDRPPPQQQPTAAAEERLPSGFRYVNGVPLWGDSDGWPRTAEEHAERDAHYSARRDLSEADRYDDNTVRGGRQTAAEQRAVREEQKRSRQRARAKHKPARDP